MKRPTRKQKIIINKLLDWMNRTYPGSKTRILGKSGLRNSLAGIGDFPEDLFDYSSLTPAFEEAAWDVPIENVPNIESEDDGGWFTETLNTIADTAKTVLPAYTNYKLQKDAYDIQMERARRGQEPIDMSRYGAPPITVRVGLPQDQFTPVIDPKTKNAIYIGAGLIAAIFLLPKILK